MPQTFETKRPPPLPLLSIRRALSHPRPPRLSYSLQLCVGKSVLIMSERGRIYMRGPQTRVGWGFLPTSRSKKGFLWMSMFLRRGMKHILQRPLCASFKAYLRCAESLAHRRLKRAFWGKNIHANLYIFILIAFSFLLYFISLKSIFL